MFVNMKREKGTWEKWWHYLIAVIFILALLSSGCSDTTEPVVEPEKAEKAEEVEEKKYNGVFKFAGEAVIGVEGSSIIIDDSVTADESRGNYTDIVIKENLTDYDGNMLTPGIYEFQFVEFPEEQGKGAWYVWINPEGDNTIRISGNPNASDSGKQYELKEGDILSVEFWTIATFYKVQ
jgi:hypothetical protein